MNSTSIYSNSFRFNQMSKKIVDTISTYEKFYIGAIEKTNY